MLVSFQCEVSEVYFRDMNFADTLSSQNNWKKTPQLIKEMFQKSYPFSHHSEIDIQTEINEL